MLFFVTSPAAGAGEGGDGAAAPLVFSGDTLFVGGCGRFFEGDASQSEHLPGCYTGMGVEQTRTVYLLSRVK